jgi:hypothetical protein
MELLIMALTGLLAGGTAVVVRSLARRLFHHAGPAQPASHDAPVNAYVADAAALLAAFGILLAGSNIHRTRPHPTLWPPASPDLVIGLILGALLAPAILRVIGPR